MAKERATEKSEHKKSKDKKLTGQDKVKKSSKNKDKKEKKEKKAKKVAKLEEELDSNPKVEEQLKFEDGATNESPVSQGEKESVDNTPVAAGDESKGSKKKGSDKKDSKKSKSEKSEKSPTNNSGEEGDGEAAAEKKEKSKKKKKKGDPTHPHLSGLNRTARRRLLLIDRQRAKIEKRMGIEPGSGERQEEVDKAVEKWTKTFDELNAKSAEKKALKAKLQTKRRMDKTKKRKDMGLSKKQFDKLKRKEQAGKKAGKKADNAAPAAPATAAA